MLRIVAFVILAGVALVACGPSSAQIKTARSASYHTTASAALQAGVASLKSNDYDVGQADPVAGKALSVARWYEEDGTFVRKNKDDKVQPMDRMVMLAIEVSVVPEGDNFRVVFTPHAQQYRSGYAALQPLNDADAPMSGWISGKIDNLYVTVYDTLKKDAVAQ